MHQDNDCPACGARGSMFRSRQCGVLVCDACDHHKGLVSRQCGVLVCDACDHHKGLVRCYCGWAESGGDGYAELEDWGETIEAEY